MRAAVTTVAVTQRDAEPVLAPVIVQAFPTLAEPLPLVDQEHELRIQAEGLLMQAEMLAWERTGDFASRGAADRHQIRMYELIQRRSPEFVERTERERGLL